MATIAKTMSDAINGNGSAAASAMEVEEQLAALRADIAGLTKALASLGANKIGDYRSSVDQMAADAIAGSLRAFDSAKSEAVSLERDFESQVRSHPLQAIGIAAGIGFLAAILTRRG